MDAAWRRALKEVREPFDPPEQIFSPISRAHKARSDAVIEDYMTLSSDWYLDECFWLPFNTDRVCIAWNARYRRRHANPHERPAIT